MRNLLEYPVTKEDVLDLLWRAEDTMDIDPELVGDLRPMIFDMLNSLIEQMSDQEFSEHFR